MTRNVSGEELSTLRDGAVTLGVRLTTEQESELMEFLHLVYVWNRAAGLTTIPRSGAVRLHLLDSLAAVPRLFGGTCLDLGTGAGMPGLVLAIASPSTCFVLVESNRRRCSFLFEVVRVLGLQNVRIVEADVESLPPDVRYPMVISRAFRPPLEFAAIASRLVAEGGRVVLMMADPTEDDLLDLQRASGLGLLETQRFHLPGGEERRTIVVLGRRPS